MVVNEQGYRVEEAEALDYGEYQFVIGGMFVFNETFAKMGIDCLHSEHFWPDVHCYLLAEKFGGDISVGSSKNVSR